ncbi:MAG: hypothetical protein CMF23_04960 [Ignavibacteriae bacterium]|nr:hypothetical protein [Ignavibacteriota bacterium]
MFLCDFNLIYIYAEVNVKENITKNKLFWILNISGWILLYLLYQVLYYRSSIDDFSKIASLFISYLSGFLITLLVRVIYKKLNYVYKPIPQILIAILVSSVIFANFWFWFDIALTYLFGFSSQVFESLTINRYFSYIWSNSFVLFAWSSLYFGIKFWYQFQSQLKKTEEAESLAQTAQLQMLRYQLNPHFLFNSLNSIRALVEEDKKRAKEMITELSEFLRYSLLSKNNSNVPFKDELEAIRHYLAIEKTRFEENLIVEYDINPNAENFPVLSFLIHPIIENAIKYGMQTSTKPLKIKVSANVDNNKFILNISNSGNWFERDSDSFNLTGTGTGLDNVKRRLENGFPNKHKFFIDKNNGSVSVNIEIEN